MEQYTPEEIEDIKTDAVEAAREGIELVAVEAAREGIELAATEFYCEYCTKCDDCDCVLVDFDAMSNEADKQYEVIEKTLTEKVIELFDECTPKPRWWSRVHHNRERFVCDIDDVIHNEIETLAEELASIAHRFCD